MATANAKSERQAFQLLPIRKVAVFREVLAQLDRYLVRSGLQPGDRLPSERELAATLQVSRVTVREALRALEGTGRVEARGNAGTFVVESTADLFAARVLASRTLDVEFLEELVDLRAAIEDRIVAVVGRRSDADLSIVRDVLERAEEEIDNEPAEPSLDLTFERALAQLSGNGLLAATQRDVHRLWVEAWTALGVAPGDRQALHDDHEHILRALEEGDVEQARVLMAEHVDRAVALALPRFDDLDS